MSQGNKNSFVMYTDYMQHLELLDMEQRGVFLTAIMQYAAGGELPEMDGMVKMAFSFAKAQIDRDTPKNRGEYHWNWKGGITPESRLERTSADYKNFRKEVLARDHYTCQICGKVGGKLNVHHVKKFSQYPELRFDVNNGITLCEKCHREVHRCER